MKKYIACFLLFAFGVSFAEDLDQKTQTKEKGFYEVMRDENIKSLLHTEKYESWSCHTTKEYCALLQKWRVEDKNPTPIQKRRAGFDFFIHHEENNPVERNETIDFTTQQDIELLYGPKSAPEFYVSSKIDRTSTEIGRITLFKKIIQPDTDIEFLQNQQKFIKTLVDNEQLFSFLDEQLKSLTIPENMILRSFNPHDRYKGILSNNPNFKIDVPFSEKLAKEINTKEFLLELKVKSGLTLSAYQNVATVIGAVIVPLLLVNKFPKIGDTAFGEFINKINEQFKLEGMSKFSLPGICLSCVRTLNKNIDFNSGTSNKVSRMWKLKYLPRMQNYYLYSFTIFKCLQDRLICVANYFNNMHSIAKIIEEHPELANYSQTLADFPKQLKKLSCENKKLKHFFKLLTKKTFKGEARYLNYAGRSIAAYRLFLELEEEITSLMLSIGELDSLVSVARLYKEFKNNDVTFCFPEYIDPKTQESPCINIENFWYPVLDTQKAVSNSLTLGKQYESKQNIIVTGPNAGGKSTTIKALVVNLILAQSLGIAAAETFTFTPFEKIMTYLNITDDIAAGNSHFKAGVVRAREVIETTDLLEKGQFGFIALDEVFNGTTFREGQAAAYSLIKKIGTNPHNICATCTHFPIIPLLEKSTDAFANYKVSIENTKGGIFYPYKLQEGISNQIITFKILEDEGFGDEFLAEAQDILENYS